MTGQISKLGNHLEDKEYSAAEAQEQGKEMSQKLIELSKKNLANTEDKQELINSLSNANIEQQKAMLEALKKFQGEINEEKQEVLKEANLNVLRQNRTRMQSLANFLGIDNVSNTFDQEQAVSILLKAIKDIATKNGGVYQEVLDGINSSSISRKTINDIISKYQIANVITGKTNIQDYTMDALLDPRMIDGMQANITAPEKAKNTQTIRGYMAQYYSPEQFNESKISAKEIANGLGVSDIGTFLELNRGLNGAASIAIIEEGIKIQIYNPDNEQSYDIIVPSEEDILQVKFTQDQIDEILRGHQTGLEDAGFTFYIPENVSISVGGDNKEQTLKAEKIENPELSTTPKAATQTKNPTTQDKTTTTRQAKSDTIKPSSTPEKAVNTRKDQMVTLSQDIQKAQEGLEQEKARKVADKVISMLQPNTIDTEGRFEKFETESINRAINATEPFPERKGSSDMLESATSILKNSTDLQKDIATVAQKLSYAQSAIKGFRRNENGEIQVVAMPGKFTKKEQFAWNDTVQKVQDEVSAMVVEFSKPAYAQGLETAQEKDTSEEVIKSQQAYKEASDTYDQAEANENTLYNQLASLLKQKKSLLSSNDLIIKTAKLGRKGINAEQAKQIASNKNQLADIYIKIYGEKITEQNLAGFDGKSSVTQERINLVLGGDACLFDKIYGNTELNIEGAQQQTQKALNSKNLAYTTYIASKIAENKTQTEITHTMNKKNQEAISHDAQVYAQRREKLTQGINNLKNQINKITGKIQNNENNIDYLAKGFTEDIQIKENLKNQLEELENEANNLESTDQLSEQRSIFSRASVIERDGQENKAMIDMQKGELSNIVTEKNKLKKELETRKKEIDEYNKNATNDTLDKQIINTLVEQTKSIYNRITNLENNEKDTRENIQQLEAKAKEINKAHGFSMFKINTIQARMNFEKSKSNYDKITKSIANLKKEIEQRKKNAEEVENEYNKLINSPEWKQVKDVQLSETIGNEEAATQYKTKQNLQKQMEGPKSLVEANNKAISELTQEISSLQSIVQKEESAMKAHEQVLKQMEGQEKEHTNEMKSFKEYLRKSEETTDSYQGPIEEEVEEAINEPEIEAATIDQQEGSTNIELMDGDEIKSGGLATYAQNTFGLDNVEMKLGDDESSVVLQIGDKQVNVPISENNPTDDFIGYFKPADVKKVLQDAGVIE